MAAACLSDFYMSKHPSDAAKACCIPENPHGACEDESYDPCQPEIGSRAGS